MTDGAFYAAAPIEAEVRWAMVFKDPHEEQVMQEDGSEKGIAIEEIVQLKSLMLPFCSLTSRREILIKKRTKMYKKIRQSEKIIRKHTKVQRKRVKCDNLAEKRVKCDKV